LARRKKKKEKKQFLKEEKFRDSMLELGKWVKEYRYPLLLGIAVIAILFVLLSMRSERRENLLAYAHNVLRKDSIVGPKELKDLAQRVEGEPIEPWVMLRLGTTLYDLYQKEDALTGDKTRLKEARKSFEGVLARFPGNGSAVFVARKALDTIDKELAYKPPDAVRDAFEGAAPVQQTPAGPREGPARGATPRKAPQPKKPEKTAQSGKPGQPDAQKPAPEEKAAAGEKPPAEQEPPSKEEKREEPSGQPGSSEPRQEGQ
jgi:hypothetical protein